MGVRIFKKPIGCIKRLALRVLAGSVLAISVLAISVLAGSVSAISVLAAPAGEATAPVPPGLEKIPIIYFGKLRPQVELPSIIESNPTDAGVEGAKIATNEINITGKFLGKEFSLQVVQVPDNTDVVSRARGLFASGPAIVVADLDAADLLALADLPEAKGSLILDMRTIDDRLRQEDCRANVFHLLPSRAMRTDALAQFLISKNWSRWLVVESPAPQDKLYTDDIRRSAARFGGKIVETRTYDYNPGSRRVDTGFQQIQQQMPVETQSVPNYDVLFVADENDLFGDYLSYNTWDARPVVGTQGLVATAWTPSFQEYSALQMQHRFKLIARRNMIEADYAGWLALRIVGEAVIRSGKTSPADLRSFLRSDQFEIAGFKGQRLTFRAWDQQLRQPVLLAQPLIVVSMSPQQGFLHHKFLTDTLGFDEPETKCHLTH